MTIPIGNYIVELCAAPGVGNFTLSPTATVTNRLPWLAGVAAGYFTSPSQVLYFATDTTKTEWGIGTYTTGGLSRDTVLWTSAGSTAKLNFATLPVYVYPDVPAERMVIRDPLTGNLIAPYDISSPTQNGGPLAGCRNRLINSVFKSNQRAVTSPVTLGAGIYGFDRWKAGAGGCTFSNSGAGINVATITAGTLQQVIEGRSIEGGTYTLSWVGTATARINSGSYQVSPITVTGVTFGAAATVEVNTGTFSQMQFEPGLQASQWEIRFSGLEQTLADSYYTQGNFDWRGYGAAGAIVSKTIALPTLMRTAPSLVLTATTNTNCGTNALVTLNNRELKLSTTVTALGSFVFVGSYTASSEL